MTTTPEHLNSLKPELSRITNLAELRLEQKRVKMRMKIHEEELRDRLKNLPGELVSSGVRAVMPAFLTGRLTNTAIDGIRTGVNSIFHKNEEPQKEPASPMQNIITGVVPTLFTGALKQVGVGAALRLVFQMLRKKKKKSDR